MASRLRWVARMFGGRDGLHLFVAPLSARGIVRGVEVTA